MPTAVPSSAPSSRPSNATLRESNRGETPMSDTKPKAFASQGDLAEKTISFTEIGRDLWAFTAEGDPNTGVIIGDESVMVVDAQATPRLAGKVIEKIRSVTDKPIKYVVRAHGKKPQRGRNDSGRRPTDRGLTPAMGRPRSSPAARSPLSAAMGLRFDCSRSRSDCPRPHASPHSGRAEGLCE